MSSKHNINAESLAVATWLTDHLLPEAKRQGWSRAGLLAGLIAQAGLTAKGMLFEQFFNLCRTAFDHANPGSAS